MAGLPPLVHFTMTTDRRLRATTDLIGFRDAERPSGIPRHRLIDAFLRGAIPRIYVDGRMKVTLSGSTMEGTYGCEQPRSDSEQSKIPTTRVRTVLLGTVAVDRIWADYAFTAAGSQILILRIPRGEEISQRAPNMRTARATCPRTQSRRRASSLEEQESVSVTIKVAIDLPP